MISIKLSWSWRLFNGVREALFRGGKHRVAVHSETEAAIGRMIAKSLAKLTGGNAEGLAFEIVPERDRGIYPTGAIIE